MVVIQVSATAKVEGRARFEQVLRQVVDEARACAGCVRYEWFHVPDLDRQVFVYGEFESEHAFAQYQQGPVVKKIGEQLLPLLKTRPSFKHFRATVMEQGGSLGVTAFGAQTPGRRRPPDKPLQPPSGAETVV